MGVSLLIAVGFFLVADVLAFLVIHARLCKLEKRPPVTRISVPVYKYRKSEPSMN